MVFCAFFLFRGMSVALNNSKQHKEKGNIMLKALVAIYRIKEKQLVIVGYIIAYVSQVHEMNLGSYNYVRIWRD